MLTAPAVLAADCSTTAGFRFTVAGGWHSAFAGILASIVFVAIVFVLTNDAPTEAHRHERGPSLRILFVTFFVFLVACFLWATIAGFADTVPDRRSGRPVPSALQPVLAVPAAWLLSIGAVLLFFAVTWLVSAYEGHRSHWSAVATTATRCFRLIAWLTVVEVWIAIETATRALAGLGWWYTPGAVAAVTVLAVPFLYADRVAARFRGRPPAPESPRPGTLGVVGVGATTMVIAFAMLTGQPDADVLHEGTWCAVGLPWWAAGIALAAMGLYLLAVGALARALPEIDHVAPPTS